MSHDPELAARLPFLDLEVAFEPETLVGIATRGCDEDVQSSLVVPGTLKPKSFGRSQLRKL